MQGILIHGAIGCWAVPQQRGSFNRHLDSVAPGIQVSGGTDIQAVLHSCVYPAIPPSITRHEHHHRLTCFRTRYIICLAISSIHHRIFICHTPAQDTPTFLQHSTVICKYKTRPVLEARPALLAHVWKVSHQGVALALTRSTIQAVKQTLLWQQAACAALALSSSSRKEGLRLRTHMHRAWSPLS